MEATERVVIQLFSHVNVRGPSNSPHMNQHRSWDSGHSATLSPTTGTILLRWGLS